MAEESGILLVGFSYAWNRFSRYDEQVDRSLRVDVPDDYAEFVLVDKVPWNLTVDDFREDASLGHDGSNEEQGEHFLGRGFFGGGLLDEGDEIMVGACPAVRPASRGRAKPLAQASDDDEPAGFSLDQFELSEEVGPQPQGIDALVSKVPVGDAGESTLTGIVEFHDTGNVVVVVGREKIGSVFGLEEPENCGDLRRLFGCAAGEQGKEGIEVGKSVAIVGLIHDSPVRDQ